ncbi:NAD(P)/FAD-dependent oxidoreductase [Kordiimonas sp. SCSIO 12603]|uniref:flavin-containing monooxygenase n=1 Tax=Kordiimonas sp. SCSIO 12603 TaxID=2829596 RepID=UPI0021035D5D|nr:NAD(P)/FAD-dependent oxidoreductase [Kordiimonas sp. SCSIO 12603]UTW58045.1 NAD(P)/FAD-dependent oxidoreductase [Kordiimonas sp. SCSIO 12603]
MQNRNASPRVAIIGAGFSGMCMAIKLKEAGYTNIKMFDKADEIGGTWRDNTYPGVACDVPSHLYSYSFAPKADWSKVFSPGGEIQEYCLGVAKEYGLYDYFVPGHELVHSEFKEGAWHLEFKNGNKETFDFVVSCIGGLHIPNYPDIPGHEKFDGVSYHSAAWNHDHDLTGKNVAIIGTAASALQIIPKIVDKVKHLDVYQRTPNWVMPREDMEYPEEKKEQFKKSPLRAKLHRLFIYSLFEMRFPMFRGNKWIANYSKKMAMKHLEEQVPDPELRAKLTPDFPVGCKRILASNTFYPALQRDNVELITEGVAKITPKGITSTEGKSRKVDTIIYATGFKPFSLFDSQEVIGRDGLKLSEYFKDGIRAHRTLTMPGFPNYFTMLGPNSGLGHNSIILIIEAQAKYIVKCLDELKKKNCTTIEPTEEAAKAFDNKLLDDLKGTVWHGSCKSWYKDEDGRIFTLWPRGTVNFRKEMKKVKPSEYKFATS